MIIQVVEKNPMGETGNHVFVNVSDEYTADQGRKIAFRIVNNRREADFNELVHSTRQIEVTKVESSVGNYILSQ